MVCIASIVCLAALLSGEGLVLRDVRLVSPERVGVLEEAFVVIQDGRITLVGTGPPPEEYHAVPSLAGEGRWLVPGRIDAHVHLGDVNGMHQRAQLARPEVVAAYWAQLPRSFLYHGFTTLIELGGRSGAFDNLPADSPHPSLYDCDHPLVLANGYGMAFEPEATRFDGQPNFLWDDRQGDVIPSRFRSEDHMPAACVARVAANGGICVKTHWEDGFGGLYDWPTPTVALIREVVSEAHGRGLPVLLHANSSAGWEFGAEAGVDVLVHGVWHWGKENGAAGIPPRVRAALDNVLARGIGFMPTCRVIEGEVEQLEEGFLDDPRLAEVLPGNLLAWYHSEEGRWFTEKMVENYLDNAAMIQDLTGVDLEAEGAVLSAVPRSFLDQNTRTLSYLLEHDGRLLFGSDTPSAPNYTNPPGLNGLLELRALHAAGVPLEKLLAAATIENARAFGLEKDLGSIEPGKRADLLLLRANPLATMDAWEAIDVVVLGGRQLEREGLSAR